MALVDKIIRNIFTNRSLRAVITEEFEKKLFTDNALTIEQKRKIDEIVFELGDNPAVLNALHDGIERDIKGL